jgi:hypothetical protein
MQLAERGVPDEVIMKWPEKPPRPEPPGYVPKQPPEPPLNAKSCYAH